MVLPGGAGYLGILLTRYFRERNWVVTVLSRRGSGDEPGVSYEHWDGKTLGPWRMSLEGADAVVNLAGRTVNCRYNAKNKAEIYASRLDSTRVLGEAIAQCAAPPPVWLNSSSATIYRHAEDRAMDEMTGEIGTGFSVDVCQRWERVFFDASTPNTRRVALRTAMVFDALPGGVKDAFEAIVRRGQGGTLGPGTQFVSWIHGLDFCRAVEWIIEHPELDGALNITSPNPLPNREFMRIWREVYGARFGLPATKWMLEIGAVFLRTETELLLKSRRVVPRRLLESGFELAYPEFRKALQAIHDAPAGI